MKEKLIENKMNPRFKYTCRSAPSRFIVIELISSTARIGHYNAAVIVESTNPGQRFGDQGEWTLKSTDMWECEKV